jgi:hypothetical protein
MKKQPAALNLRSHSLDKLIQIVTTAHSRRANQQKCSPQAETVSKSARRLYTSAKWFALASYFALVNRPS